MRCVAELSTVVRTTFVYLYQYAEVGGFGDGSLGDQGGFCVSARVNISGRWWEPLRSYPLLFFFLFSSTPAGSSPPFSGESIHSVILEASFYLSFSNWQISYRKFTLILPPFKYAFMMAPFLLHGRHRRRPSIFYENRTSYFNINFLIIALKNFKLLH